MCWLRRKPSAALARTDASIALRTSNASRRRSYRKTPLPEPSGIMVCTEPLPSADDGSAPMVLECAGHDLGTRGRAAVDQHDHPLALGEVAGAGFAAGPMRYHVGRDAACYRGNDGLRGMAWLRSARLFSHSRNC